MRSRKHNMMKIPKPLIWKDGTLQILDQTRLPEEVIWVVCRTCRDVADAIYSMKVRGAPAIGVAAGYGVALSDDPESAIDILSSTRPTGRNLFYVLERMREAVRRGRDLLSLARRIEEEEEERCRKIAENGFSLLRDGISILTHCNAGPLATCGIGTALGPLYIAKERGVDVKVFVTETRPKRQGARLTVWELKEAGICVRLIADTAVGYIMERGYIDAIFVGADRIAENGDCANKIGTYQIAVLAKFHKIPFYVAAPSSTFDKNLSDGSKIIVEERGKEELTSYDVDVLNPAFDITPSELITGIITEDGILRYGA